ncbi:MAG: aminomethyl-transferring glycine dehydrogenase subunit GcvPA [Acidimicrobiia bacterium]|nr:aminomethyl-transferring glycine dehydrogenase subunit GcvPA [Acidimicrobiia bacterium]
MDFTPHTAADIEAMLSRVGLSSVEDLFGHLPDLVRVVGDLDLPAGISEPELVAAITALAERNDDLVCFAGGGHYDHYLPPTVRSLNLRTEFVTSYTPYQPEVSQGVLQALFEYQSMVCAITGMDVANASVYDGAGAALEAVNVAVAATRRNVIWVSGAVGPQVRQTIATFAHARGIAMVEHPVVAGVTHWNPDADGPPAAVVVAQPNYLGAIESYGSAVEVAHTRGALAIAVVDPMTLGLLRTPGEAGVDIAIAEGQPLGGPLTFGGPGVGLFAVTESLVRRLPGRLVGTTTDDRGRLAYVLTLRAREQDIRREKASSNICTNQSLNAIGVAIQLAWLGPDGLTEVGRQSAQKARYLAARLTTIDGVKLAHPAAYVREFAVTLPVAPAIVIDAMAKQGILAGIDLSADYPELENGLLIALTEQRTKEQIDAYISLLKEVIAHA